MARAADQHTLIEWTLEDLLKYLTLAPFGYEIDDALREMERAISAGDLPLIDEEYVDGKLKRRYRLDPFYFRKHYTLEFGHHDHRVRAVPRQRELLWGKSILHFYLLFEQDALRVWPRHLPASQQQPEDKAAPDRSAAAQRRPTKASKSDSGVKPNRKRSPEQVARDAAIKRLLDNGGRPPSNVTWPKFCQAVRVEGDGFIGDPKDEKYKRGFTDDTIEEVTRELMKLLPR